MPNYLVRALAQVIATALLFMVTLWVNESLFQALEFARGINFVYLPAGVRLLCTLLFGSAGALGLLLVSWYVSFVHFFPNDPERAFVGGILGALAPWLTYLVARRFYGLQSSLRGLTANALLALAVAYAVASPLLHHLWFATRGERDLLSGFLAMFIGDLSGTLIILYGMKALLSVGSRALRTR